MRAAARSGVATVVADGAVVVVVGAAEVVGRISGFGRAVVVAAARDERRDREHERDRDPRS